MIHGHMGCSPSMFKHMSSSPLDMGLGLFFFHVQACTYFAINQSGERKSLAFWFYADEHVGISLENVVDNLTCRSS